jgi:hypothetical protein
MEDPFTGKAFLSNSCEDIESNIPTVEPDPQNNFRLIHQSVIELSDGNQIQDGCHSRHLGWAAELVIEAFLLLVASQKQVNPTNRS